MNHAMRMGQCDRPQNLSFDVLLDLHTASFGRVNSLYVRADMSNPRTARLAYLQRPQIIVHNPPHDKTLRGSVAALGIPAVTVEIGNPHRYNRHYIRQSLTGVRRVLGDMGMVRSRVVRPGEPPVLCWRSYWIYTDHGGLLDVVTEVVKRVSPSETVAVLRDSFGVVTREYKSPEQGIVIGHSVNPVASTGSPLSVTRRSCHVSCRSRTAVSTAGSATSAASRPASSALAPSDART